MPTCAQLSMRLASHPSAESPPPAIVSARSPPCVRGAREQTLAHAPLAIFTLVAMVLVLFMLRT